MIFTYKIADVAFSADIRYKNTYLTMEEYLAPDETPEFQIVITDRDLAQEKALTPYTLPDYAYESTAVYRKYIYIMIERYDAFFFHCSSIAVDNKAIMFTAKSGTGKSTHRNLWIKNLGDRVTIINDDKPIIRKIDGKFYVYGTPWQGKESLGSNIRVPAFALCFLSRSETNSIGPIDTVSVVAKMMNQIVRPKDPKLMANALDLLDEFLEQVTCYDLRVNMDDEAAVVAYNGIFRG
ncbi:MAG: hypothetical protein ACI4RM_01815 [Ruminococcus sp.]